MSDSLKKKIFAISLLSVVFAGAIALAENDVSVLASQNTVSNISYPVAELGGCTDKASCRAYCNLPENMESCTAFAESKGLIGQKEAMRGKSFSSILKTSGGPGGCKTPLECREYCSDISNSAECASFAKVHNLSEDKARDAEKISEYLKTGGTMPGSCTTKDSCRKYCSDFSNTEECKSFAEKLGLTMSKGVNVVPPGQIVKVAALAKEGKTPGSCTTGDECKAYCDIATNRDECLNFAREAGLLPEQKVEQLKNEGIVGPGGCNSKESCRAYCNDPVNRETCFNFAKERGFISDEAVKIAQEGIVRLRAGLANAPEPVLSCIKSELGDEVFLSIQSGTFTPNERVGEIVKKCFERFNAVSDVGEEIKNAPAPVAKCLKEKLGTNFNSTATEAESLTPERADAVRVCIETAQILFKGPEKRDTTEQIETTNNLIPKPLSDEMRIKNFIQSAPYQIRECVSLKAGQIESLDESSQIEKLRPAIEECMKEFKPTIPKPRPLPTSSGENNSREDLAPNGISPIPNNRPLQFRPEVVSCLKSKLELAQIERLMRGAEPADARTKEVVARCMMENSRQPMPSQKQIPSTVVPGSTNVSPSSTQNEDVDVLEDIPDIEIDTDEGLLEEDVNFEVSKSFSKRLLSNVVDALLDFVDISR